MPVTVLTPSDLEIVVKRELNAPRDLVWKAYMTPALLKRWMLGPAGWEMPVCEVDARVGGKYRYVWAPVGGGPGGFGLGGEYLEIDAPKRHVATQLFDGVDMGRSGQIVTLQLDAIGERTMSTTTILHKTREERDMALRSGMSAGMEAGYVRLEEVLATLGRI
jgi:uncharacterized protein YndB with AHSA1/START domain